MTRKYFPAYLPSWPQGSPKDRIVDAFNLINYSSEFSATDIGIFVKSEEWPRRLS